VKTQPIFAIHFTRQPRVDELPGLVSLAIGRSPEAAPSRKIGALTDVALRGRLAHFDVHSANEVAAIRKALVADSGETTVYESWPALSSCLHFWQDFVGSRVRAVEWTCGRCAAVNRENVGSNVGETYSRACKCGRVTRITTSSSPAPVQPAPARPAPVQ
jgi:hypothetical protein